MNLTPKSFMKCGKDGMLNSPYCIITLFRVIIFTTYMYMQVQVMPQAQSYSLRVLAYFAVVYLKSTNANGAVRTSIVIAKTKVSPIKCTTIPPIELCEAFIVARLLHHRRKVLEVPLGTTYTWTDSTIVLSWLHSNPNRFKPFVGNCAAETMEMIPPN